MMSDAALLRWIINSLLTDSQLDVKPPGSQQTLRWWFHREERPMSSK